MSVCFSVSRAISRVSKFFLKKKKNVPATDKLLCFCSISIRSSLAMAFSAMKTIIIIILVTLWPFEINYVVFQSCR